MSGFGVNDVKFAKNHKELKASKQAEQAVGSELVSSTPPWLPLQWLSPRVLLLTMTLTCKLK